MRFTSGVLAAIVATLMHPLYVSAGMHSAQPTSTMAHPLGGSISATWTDSAEEPRLTDMGLIKMDLYSLSNTLAGTLVQSVVSISHTQTLNPRDSVPALMTYTAAVNLARATSTASSTTANDTSSSSTQYVPTLVIPSRSYLPTDTINTIRAKPLGHDHSKQTNAGDSATRGKRLDIEKIKFRVVFILWPAIIGISMAL